MKQNPVPANTPADAHTLASGQHAAGPTSLTPTYSLPPANDEALQAAVAAILNLSGDVLPAPFNAEAQKEALSKIPVAEHTRNFQGLDLESLQRLVEAATLSNRLIYDLASMPVESREALDSETMETFVASAMDSLATNVATLRTELPKYSALMALAGRTIESGRKGYRRPFQMAWREEICREWLALGVTIEPLDTSAAVYEKMAAAIAQAEQELVQSNVQWLLAQLKAQRLNYYRSVGRHLKNEANVLRCIALSDYSAQAENPSWTVLNLAEVAKAPFLLEWPATTEMPRPASMAQG
jgi:hypothetical protein